MSGDKYHKKLELVWNVVGKFVLWGVSLRWHLIDERFQWCEIAARQISRGIFCWLVCYCNLQRQLDELSSYLDGIWLRLTSNVGSVRINSLTFGESLRCLGWCWFSCLEQVLYALHCVLSFASSWPHHWAFVNLLCTKFYFTGILIWLWII